MSTPKGCVCVLCGSTLENKEALQEHFRKHANKGKDDLGRQKEKRNSAQDPSPKTFSKGPVRSKSPVPCDVCPMIFDSVSLAIQHKFRKHPSSPARHHCPLCGAQFPLESMRRKHYKTAHPNEPIVIVTTITTASTTTTTATSGGGGSVATTVTQPVPNHHQHVCRECSAVFANNHALLYHCRSAHGLVWAMFRPLLTPPPSRKIRVNHANEVSSVYFCHLCGAEYIVKFNLRKHLECSHTAAERDMQPQNLLKCTTCEALFYTRKAYENHNLFHKPEDLYVTSEEQRLQTVSRVDLDFDIRRVEPTANTYLAKEENKKTRRTRVNSHKVVKKNDSDDELSPTSSIDSSDSETEVKTTKKKPKMDSEKKNSVSS